MDLSWFNAFDTEPLGAKQTAVPAGDYLVVIIASQEKQTKAGNGSYLSLTLEIIDGPHKGDTIWSMVTLRNPSVAAVRMGERTLSSICRAVGKLAPADSTDLHDVPIIVTVELVDARNRVVAWQAASPSPAAPTPSTPTPQVSRAPWAKS